MACLTLLNWKKSMAVSFICSASASSWRPASIKPTRWRARSVSWCMALMLWSARSARRASHQYFVSGIMASQDCSVETSTWASSASTSTSE